MSETTLRSAAVPRRPAAAGWLGLLLAVALVALGALAFHDGVVLQGWAQGRPLLSPRLSGQTALGPGTLTTAIGVVAALLGLFLAWLALRPGRRRGAELDAGTGVWLTWSDVERLVVSTAEQQDGVLSARASASSRRVRVDTRITANDVQPAVEQAVSEALTALRRPPRVVVRARATE